MAYDTDFIGFTYNGKHSINYFGIYRTSDGNRYNDNLIPPMTDKAIDVPGGDGQYYFYTNHKARQFSIPIAFDSLTESKYREMRNWLDGKEIHDLVFDEVPYKVYSAKVTGTPQLKTICFDNDGERIYKGEGTIQFTCYHPYAHTPLGRSKEANSKTPTENIIKCGIVVFPGSSLKVLGLLKGTFNYIDLITKERLNTGVLSVTSSSFVFQNYSFIDNIVLEEDSSGNALMIDSRTFYYTNNLCFENQGLTYKDINGYNITDYPNKAEWALTFL